MEREHDTGGGRLARKCLHCHRHRRQIACRIEQPNLGRPVHDGWGRRIATDLTTERRTLFAPLGLKVTQIEVHTQIVGRG